MFIGNIYSQQTLFQMFMNYKKILRILNYDYCALRIILFICFERLVGVRYPFLIRRYATDSALFRRSLLMFIIAMTGLLTIYRHFSHVTKMKPFCNNTQIYAYHAPVNAAV